MGGPRFASCGRRSAAGSPGRVVIISVILIATIVVMIISIITMITIAIISSSILLLILLLLIIVVTTTYLTSVTCLGLGFGALASGRLCEGSDFSLDCGMES